MWGARNFGPRYNDGRSALSRSMESSLRFLESLMLIAALALSGCAGQVRSQQRPPKWTTGFWLWSEGAGDTSGINTPLDSLYILAGNIQYGTRPFAVKGWAVYANLPRELPAASENWLVFRSDGQSVPDQELVPLLVERVLQLRVAASSRKIELAGVQLDIDCPTGKLSNYAVFLGEMRKALPPGMRISITALLDWFRDGTSVADVVAEVDEFVPQFYDIENRGSYRGDRAIASKIDAALWTPRFNRFGKFFRIGVSTFGRSRIVPAEDRQRNRYLGALYFRDLKPLDIAVDSAFNLQTSRNEEGETVLNYRASRATRAGYGEIRPGDTFQFILSTPETVRAAVKSAMSMGPNCTGVIFFRWPTSSESLVMQPGEVLAAAGLPAAVQPKSPNIHVVDGGCAAVRCVDLYLEDPRPLSAQPVRYEIRSSTEFEYFLPEEGVPIRMAGPSLLVFLQPPYCGRGRLYLGRAVTAAKSDYVVTGSPTGESR